MKVTYNGEVYEDIVEILESENNKITLVQAMCPCGNNIELESSVELKVEIE